MKGHGCLFVAIIAFSMAGAALAVEPDEIITDPVQIEIFLKSPNTKVLSVAEPKSWKSYRKYIQVGKRDERGGCIYASTLTTTGPIRLVSTEIAHDAYTCRSLILEGEPDDSTWDSIMNFFKGLKNREVHYKKRIGLLEFD